MNSRWKSSCLIATSWNNSPLMPESIRRHSRFVASVAGAFFFAKLKRMPNTCDSGIVAFSAQTDARSKSSASPSGSAASLRFKLGLDHRIAFGRATAEAIERR